MPIEIFEWNHWTHSLGVKQQGISMARITREELDRRLNKNGWAWHLISNATPGIIRIQLADDGEEETGWRECVEASTLEEAIAKAEKLVHSINAYEFGKRRK